MPSFPERLRQAVENAGSPLVLGLDPRPESRPETHPSRAGPHVAEAVAEHLTGVVDRVAGIVGVVKPNSAFFEALGPSGVSALAELLAHCRGRGLITILDAKRGDIGSTAEAYRRAYLEDGPLAADAITVSPYLGRDSIEPYLAACRADRGIFVLVKTSNPGSADIQEQGQPGGQVWTRVASMVARLNDSLPRDAGYGPVGAVVGVTNAAAAPHARTLLPGTWILAPGLGAQEGEPRVLRALADRDGLGVLPSVSRAILEPPAAAAAGRDAYLAAVEAATRQWRESIGAAVSRQGSAR